jgi:hypothetical protein
MSPDPDNAGASIDNPQSWNAYSYVLNNPLKYTDPNGLDCIYLNDTNDQVDHIKSGDCASETDNGYYVDSKEGTVQKSDVSFSTDKNTILVSFSSENDLPTQGHFQQFCAGSCPNDSVTVSTGLGDPIPTTMSALRGGLMPSRLDVPQVQANFDFWNMTKQQQSEVSECLATGGEEGPEKPEPGQTAAQVRGANGEPQRYPGNYKPVMPNIKGAKRAGGVSGVGGAFGFIGGGLSCVNNLATQSQ